MQENNLAFQDERIRLHCFDEVESTNKIVKLAIANGESAGFVVVAKCQNSGRGLREHRWESPKGGLYMSIIFDTNVRGNDLVELPFKGAEIVMRTLQEFSNIELAIKRPNDIVVKKSLEKSGGLIEKMCGISTEYYLGKICCGIGVNILRSEEEINIKEYAPAYLQDYSERKIKIDEVRDAILNSFLINSNDGLSI